MNEKIFLFPETPQTNPSSFLLDAYAINYAPVVVEGFKLCAFPGTLDNLNYPFMVAPVKSKKKSVTMYQFRFNEEQPIFSVTEFSQKQTENGIVLYLSSNVFSRYASKYGSITIKSGCWTDYNNYLHQQVAFYHLDVAKSLPQVCNHDNELLESHNQLFQELYGDNITLQNLFTELVFLLKFFDLTSDCAHLHLEDGSYYFGSLFKSFEKFNSICFPKMLLDHQTISPASVHHLRMMFKFVKKALSHFGYETTCEDSILTIIHQFQSDKGLTVGYCDQETMHLILNTILSDPNELLSALKRFDISFVYDTADRNERFGRIEVTTKNEAATIITDNLSQIISMIPSPKSIVANANDQFLNIAHKGSSLFRDLNEKTQDIEAKIKKTKEITEELDSETSTLYDHSKSITFVLDHCIEINTKTKRNLEQMKANLLNEGRQTNILVILLLLLLMIIISRFLLRIGFRAILPSYQNNATKT